MSYALGFGVSLSDAADQPEPLGGFRLAPSSGWLSFAALRCRSCRRRPRLPMPRNCVDRTGSVDPSISTNYLREDVG